MDELTQTISNLVGILLGIVGAVGVGFFIYGAYLYLTASGAPHQMERGKSAMMTALAGIVLAMVAYGVVELVMNAVVGSPVDPNVPDPSNSGAAETARQLGERKEKSHERTRGSDPRAGRGQGPAGVHLPAGRGDDGGVRPVLRRIPLRPRRAVGGEDGDCRPPGPGGAGRRRREDRWSAAAPGAAADLLKYRLGARLYAGPPSELARSEPPAPAQPVKSGPGPLRLMARRAGKTLRRLRPKRGSRERTGGRMPFRPHRWFGKHRRTDKDNINGNGNGDGSRKSRQSKPPKSFLAIAAAVALAAAVAVPQAALADDHEPWRDEIDCRGRGAGRRAAALRRGTHRLGDRAAVTLRAATPLDLRVRAFGGPQGSWLGAVEGAVASECVSTTLERVELQTVSGHASVTETALMDAEVTGIAGTLTVAGGGSQASVAFVPNGENRFRVVVG